MKKYHKNPRTLTKKQFELLKRDLQELGDLSGIVYDVNSDEIISGNQRSEIFDVNSCKIEIIKQYKKPTKTGTVADGWIYYKGEKYSYRKVDWTPEQCEKANIVANKAGGSWDFDILANMFDAGDLLDWGFSDTELVGLDFCIDKDGLTEDDAIPEDVETICQTGDLWQLGEHRLLCGDATKEEDIKKLMNGEKADMVFTDPPYGVDFKGQKYNPKAKNWKSIKNDKIQGENLTKWLKIIIRFCMDVSFKKASFYFFTAAMAEGAAAATAIRESGIHIQSQIIWVKNCLVLGQADYQWRHENLWYGFLKGEKHNWFGGRKKTTVWEESKDSSCSYQHPMQKPISLAVRALENSTKCNMITLDPFLGSGSTLIACEKTNRKCYGMEIDEHYCDVIIKRYEDYTGNKAKKIVNRIKKAK